MCQKVADGVFYTDPLLSRFASWYARDLIPKGDYTLLDPCCGSGNLFLNNHHLGSPTIIASDLTPTLPHAIQANFLTVSAKEYLDLLPPIDKTKPLLIFSNPPYRGDDNQTAGNAGYAIHPSILDVIGGEGAAERYNCFLAQMKLICDQAISHNLPGNSLLLVFSACGWLTNRPSFQKLRNMIVSSFDFDRGFMINGKEFFEGLTGKFPIAFTIWRYREKQINKTPHSIVTLSDLTWLSKKDVDFFKDNHETEYDAEFQRRGEELLKDHKTKDVAFGVERVLFKTSFNLKRNDFIRNRKRDEIGDPLAGGLPLNDRRRTNKVTYGESTGNFIGFMDDLTPCRIKKAVVNIPWFHLNPQFMHANINRCFSGPHNCRGYHAQDLSSAQKCFVWYALARTFRTCGYPMFTHDEELWAVSSDPIAAHNKLIDYAFAIGFAENECVETVFPAHNPIKGVPEIAIANPMTPNNPKSFWNTVMLPAMTTKPDLINAVNAIFKEWASRFKDTSEIVAPFQKPYFITQGVLRKTAGLIQIRHYAEAVNDDVLLKLDETRREVLKETKKEFYDFLVNDLDYFGNSNVKAL